MTPPHGFAKSFRYFWIRLALWKIMKWSTFGNFTLPVFIISPNTASPLCPKALLQLSTITLCPFLFFYYQKPSLGKNLISIIYTIIWNSFYLTVERKIVFFKRVLSTWEQLEDVGKGAFEVSLKCYWGGLYLLRWPCMLLSSSFPISERTTQTIQVIAQWLQIIGKLSRRNTFPLTTRPGHVYLGSEYLLLSKLEMVWLEVKTWSVLHTNSLITHAK